MSGPMFGSSSTLTGSTDGNRHLVEFRAGRMTLTGTIVTADLRKGLVYLYRTEAALVHFCWKDRSNGTTEEDLLIFPDDCVFKRVPQCTTGRVYLLKFKTHNRKFFFWMQEPSAAKDEELCGRVNDIMNNVANSPSTDIQDVLSHLSQNQLMSLFGRGGGLRGIPRTSSTGINPLSPFVPLSVTPARRARLNATASPEPLSDNATGVPALTPATPNQPITMTTPQAPRQAPIRVPTIRISSSASSSDDMVSDSARLTTASPGQSTDPNGISELRSFLSAMEALDSAPSVSVDLSTAMTGDTVMQFLGDPDHTNALFSYLPPIDSGENSKVQLKNTILSSQFREALSLFSAAFQSGQLGPVLSHFDLSTEAYAAVNFGNFEAFVKALERSAIRAASTIKIIKKEDDDEDMEGDL